MREIVLDTETTGIDPDEGHRIIEIGCVELINHMPTGKTYWTYINPERDIDAGAMRVHGITNDKVADKPVFSEIVGDFLDFIAGATLVIHNAEFDIKFLNAELKRCGFPLLRLQETADTLLLARKKYPGQPANLDALCRRFNIDLSGRDLHGALLDAQLLSQVYLELLGGVSMGWAYPHKMRK
jgi:DNA polymerase-3 subunit epsilon